MRPAVDILVDATTAAVAQSGMTEGIARMGTVSFVGTDGTITVDLAEGPVPKVRMLAQVYRPVVGDLVEVIRTRAGWVCLGKLATSNYPRLQSGTALTSSGSGLQTATVTFPVAFPAPPNVIANVVTTVPQNVSEEHIYSVTATNFVFRVTRSTSAQTGFNWIATDL